MGQITEPQILCRRVGRQETSIQASSPHGRHLQHTYSQTISFILKGLALTFAIIALYCGVELTTPAQPPGGTGLPAGITLIQTEDGVRCIRPDGSVRTGFVTWKGHSYFFGRDGLMETGIVTIGDSVFGFDANGHKLSGLAYVDSTLYDFAGQAHCAVTGLAEINGSLYDFRTDGRQALGVQTVDGRIYAFTGEDGSSVTGWADEGDSHYYITDDHQMQNGLLTVDGCLYHFENSKAVGGVYVENGQRYSFTGERNAAVVNTWSGDHQYYYGSDHTAVTGVQLVDGEYYRFQDDGALAEDLGTKEEYEAKLAEQALQQKLQAAAANQGNVGNICVPDLGLDTALYSCYICTTPEEANVSQAICDRGDSACYFLDTAQPILADHNFQGFSALANAYGKYMYLTRGSTVTRYICTGVYSGVNTGSDLFCNGTSVVSNRIASLVAYTCHTSWQDIWVVTFEPA